MEDKYDRVAQGFSLRLPKEVWDVLKCEAQDNLRTLTNQICMVLTAYTEQRTHKKYKSKQE